MLTCSGPTGRQFEDDAHHLLNSIDQELDSLSQSEVSVEEILCLPRQVCDRLRSKKHLLDQYPNMKTVAAWMTEKYFENVVESSSEYYSPGTELSDGEGASSSCSIPRGQFSVANVGADIPEVVGEAEDGLCYDC